MHLCFSLLKLKTRTHFYPFPLLTLHIWSSSKSFFSSYSYFLLIKSASLSEIRVFIMVRWLSLHMELLCMLLLATLKVAPSYKYLMDTGVNPTCAYMHATLKFLVLCSFCREEAEKPRAIHLASCYTFLDMYSLAMLRYLFDRAKPVTIQGALQNLSWRRL